MIFSETLPENGYLSPLVKRLRLARTFFSGAPMWCSWQVTYRCMFRCEFCGRLFIIWYLSIKVLVSAIVTYSV